MNDTAQQLPTDRQRKYLGRLLAAAHQHGVPYLPTEHLTRAQVSDWIDYLKTVVGEDAEEPSGSSPYLVTPAHLPPSYRPPWRELPDADDHEHVVGTIRRSDGAEQSICVSCGVSA
jgi:hypothetical protein